MQVQDPEWEEFQEFRKFKAEKEGKERASIQRKERNPSAFSAGDRKSTIMKCFMAIWEPGKTLTTSQVRQWVTHHYGWMQMSKSVGSMLTSLCNDGHLKAVGTVSEAKERWFAPTEAGIKFYFKKN